LKLYEVCVLRCAAFLCPDFIGRPNHNHLSPPVAISSTRLIVVVQQNLPAATASVDCFESTALSLHYAVSYIIIPTVPGQGLVCNHKQTVLNAWRRLYYDPAHAVQHTPIKLFNKLWLTSVHTICSLITFTMMVFFVFNQHVPLTATGSRCGLCQIT